MRTATVFAHIVAAAMATSLAAGCNASSTDDTGGDHAGGGKGDDPAADDGAVITVLGGRTWTSSSECPSPDPSTCLRTRGFSVDLQIRNDAYDKHVGVVWIDVLRDGELVNWRVADAHHVGPLDAPYEAWLVDAAAGTYRDLEPKPRIQFAAFVEMNGEIAWDNNGGADFVIE